MTPTIIPALIKLHRAVAKKLPQVSIDIDPSLIGYWAGHVGLPCPVVPPNPGPVARFPGSIGAWSKTLRVHGQMAAAAGGWRQATSEG